MSRKIIITVAAAGFFSPLNTSPPASVFGSSAANGVHGGGGTGGALSPAAAHSGNDYPTLVTLGNPSMGIILVVLLCTFLFMGFFTYYVRRYAELQGEMVNALHHQPAAGLDPAAMAKLPLVTFSSQGKGGVCGGKAEFGGGSSGSQSECVVCLTDFEDMETLKLLPRCQHCFHPDCIDMWLYSHSTCPLCRRSLLADKGSSKGKASARVVDDHQQQEQIAVIVSSSAAPLPGGSHGSIEDQQEARGQGEEQAEGEAVICKEDMRPYNWRSHSTGHSIASLPAATGRRIPPWLLPRPPLDDLEIGLAPNRRENPVRIVIFPRQEKATEGGEQASSSSSS